MTTLAEAYAVDPKLDLDLASFVVVFRLRNRSHGLGRLTFLVISSVGSETALSVFMEDQLDERLEMKLFTYHWKPDFVKLKE